MKTTSSYMAIKKRSKGADAINMPVLARENTLTSFFDLKIAPLGFDVITFLILSEIHRRQTKCDEIHFVIVPNESTGLNVFGHLNPFGDDQATWRMFNLASQAAGLMDTCHGMTICPTREHARSVVAASSGPTYPKQYDIDNPAPDSWIFPLTLMYGNMGVEIPSLTPPAQALEYADTWIAENAGGRKVISITLREGSFNEARNSNVADWAKFTAWIDKETYFPVVLPDIETVTEWPRPEFGDTAFFCEAVLNLQLRAAFYRRCYLNLIVGAGPEELQRYDGGARYIKFRSIAPHELEWEPSHALRHGLPPDGRYPFLTPYQKIVLEPDTFTLIQSEFLKMAEKIEARPEDAFAVHPLRFPKPIGSDHIIDVFNRFVDGVQYDHAFKYIIMYLGLHPEDDATKTFLRKFVVRNGIEGALKTIGSVIVAEWPVEPIRKLFVDAYNEASDEFAWAVCIAMIDVGVGQTETAEEWLSKAEQLASGDPSRQAQVSSCRGWLELAGGIAVRSIEHIETANELDPSPDFGAQLVLVWARVGNIKKAGEALNNIMETTDADTRDEVAIWLRTVTANTGPLEQVVKVLLSHTETG